MILYSIGKKKNIPPTILQKDVPFYKIISSTTKIGKNVEKNKRNNMLNIVVSFYFLLPTFVKTNCENKMKDNTIVEKKMCDAMAVANYFIKRANDEGTDLTLLKLLKLCFLAHGYCLALLQRSFLSRYDTVEAWKYGPVIPSIYHSFKHWGATPITKKGAVMVATDENQNPIMKYPLLDDHEIEEVTDFVWKRYSSWTASELVTLLHKYNSPWQAYYRAGENAVISDEYTQLYYTFVVRNYLARRRKEKETQK